MTTRTHPTNTHQTPHPTRTGCPATQQIHVVWLPAHGSQRQPCDVVASGLV